VPKEIRHVQFDAQDLRAALTSYLRRVSWTNPITGVGSIELAEDPFGPVAIVMTQTPHGPREVVVPSEDLHSALLMYCKHARIPLPIRSVKSLQRSGEALILDVSRTTGPRRHDTILPPIRRRHRALQPPPPVLGPPPAASD